MATKLSDRWLWFGAGVFFFAAVKSIQYALTDLVRLTELDADQYPSVNDDEGQPEDGIALSTLHTLVKSPNPSISQSAQSLIIKRFANLPDATEILSRDILSSNNDETRRKAKQAVQFLHDWDLELRDTLPLPISYADDIAFRDPQDGSVQVMDRSEWDSFVESRSREDGLLDSGMVTRLEELSAELAERERERDLDIDGFRHRFAEFWQQTQGRIPPGLAPGDVEAERRRRRREAMVLHEGDGGIVEGDIIRPRGR